MKSLVFQLFYTGLLFRSIDALPKPYLGSSASYHDYEQMTHVLRHVAKTYSTWAHLKSIGKSVEGRDLWVLSISGQKPTEHVLFRPEVALLANMHGNEVVGKELLLYLAIHLLSRYGHDKEVTHLLDTRRVHLLPSINPDGLAAARGEGDCDQALHIGRWNARKIDLNRDFANRLHSRNETVYEGEPETIAIMKWLDSVPLVLAANLHGGALVANYPWDSNKARKQVYTAAPDDDVLRYLALLYSNAHSTMHEGLPCDQEWDEDFLNGITNGAHWYPVDGSLQDYQYAFKGTMALTLEISCCKYPPASSLPHYWTQNRHALLALLHHADKGVRGLILDSNGNPISGATLMVQGRDISFHTSPHGEFWRVLLPGDYVLQVEAEGYANVDVPFTVPAVDEAPPYASINVTLWLDEQVPSAPAEADDETIPTASSSKTYRFENYAVMSYAVLTLLLHV